MCIYSTKYKKYTCDSGVNAYILQMRELGLSEIK